MKKVIYSTILFTTALHQIAFSANNLLFNVDAKGLTLSITSIAPHHTYPAVGIKINTPGVTLSNNAPGCNMSTNGYCLFAVSDTSPANIITSGTAGDVSFTLCLNGNSAISCQNYTRTLTGPLSTVGYYQNTSSGFLPISYISNDAGLNWTLSNDGILPLLPPPVDSAIPANSDLRLSSCDTSGQNCVALGIYKRGVPPSYITANGYALLAYSSDTGGKNWSLSSMPLPANSWVGINANIIPYLYSNICDPTGKNCTAVGYYPEAIPPNYTSVIRTSPLGYTTIDGGKNWTLSSLPLPNDIINNSTTAYNNFLLSTTCDLSGLLCTAVGYYTQGTSPNYTTFNGNLPLAYSSNNGGQTWTLSATLPIPANALTTTNKYLRLRKTACSASGTTCTALGNYRQTSNDSIPLGYTSSNGGQTWTLSNQGNLPLLPLPANTVQGGIGLAGTSYRLSCDSSGLICVAVSLYKRANSSSPTSSIGTVPMGYTSINGGQTWTLRDMPLPADTWQSSTSSFTLSSMSCDSTGKRCVVVGYYDRGVSPTYTTYNGNTPFSYSSSNGGQTWTLSNQSQPLPLPADAASGANSTSTTLQSVSCKPNGLDCTAVGEYTYIGSINNDDRALAYTSKDGGNTWVLSNSFPLPSDSKSIVNTGLLSVS